MARCHTRTRPHQLASDSTLQRRSGMPLAIDMKVSEAGSAIYNMRPPGEPGSVFDALPPLSLRLDRDEIPKIHFGTKRGLFWTLCGGSDKPVGKQGLASIATISLAAKMACPCFSLPAGATREQGTCLAADRVLASGTQDDPDSVCGQCYAQEGHYIHFETCMARATTFAFVRQQLVADPTGVGLAAKLVAMIEHYARSSVIDSLNARMVQEIGTWDTRLRAITVPAKIPTPERRWRYPAVETVFAAHGQRPTGHGRQPTAAVDTTRIKGAGDLFEARGAKDGEVVGFFRVNDSGDLYVHPRLWSGLVRAWIETARRLPNVLFWIPTRMWELPAALPHLQAAAAVENITLRPSGAMIGGAPPQIDGLAAGTSVRRKGVVVPDSLICPAYSGKKASASCIAQGCRACWVLPGTPVAYTHH